jgi:hypothetical protein
LVDHNFTLVRIYLDIADIANEKYFLELHGLQNSDSNTLSVSQNRSRLNSLRQSFASISRQFLKSRVK